MTATRARSLKGAGRWVTVLCLARFLAFCSSDPEKTHPGSCALSCGNAIIGAKEFSAKAITNNVNVSCVYNGALAAIPLTYPIGVSYLITDENGNPRPNISIQPDIQGGVDANSTNPENIDKKNSDGTIVPYHYAGIVTPRSQFCSDSCGVVSLEFVPFCMKGITNAVTVQIGSGAMTSDVINVTIANSSSSASSSSGSTPSTSPAPSPSPSTSPSPSP